MVVETGVALTEAGSAVTTTAIFVVFAVGIAASPPFEGALHALSAAERNSAARILDLRGIKTPGLEYAGSILPECEKRANLNHEGCCQVASGE